MIILTFKFMLTNNRIWKQPIRKGKGLEKFTRTKALLGEILGLCVKILLFLVGRPSPEAGTIGMILSFPFLSFLILVPLSPLKFLKKMES